MGINLRIHNVKNIDDFEFIIPTKKGLYALTGENGTGKSTVISCAAAAFYVPSFDDYYGKPRNGAYIRFNYNGKTRSIEEKEGKWKSPSRAEALGITGFYEGSIVFGNRFKDIEYSLLGKLASIKQDDLENASVFVKTSLGEILHDDKSYYNNLFVLKDTKAKNMGLKRAPYYYKNKGALFSQLNMSTGENLLLTILNSLERRIKKEVRGEGPAYIFLDEIELALHSSALRRLVYFLRNIAEDRNTVVLFSTHSIELIRSITPTNIYYLQNHSDGSIETINPCFPVYATRNLESSNYGHDCIILVEDDLAQSIVNRILREKKLLSNKRVLVIAVGGWMQVLRFASDTIRSNLALKVTKILIILDRDIKNDVPGFLKNERIGFKNAISYLPIKSLEKYLLDKLVLHVDVNLFRELNDYVFQSRSLDDLVKQYNQKIKDGKIKDEEKIKNGKALYSILQEELRNVRKTDSDLVSIVVDYLFENRQAEIEELANYLQQQFDSHLTKAGR